MYYSKEILAKEGISNFEKDIRFMSTRELKRHFRFKTRRKLNPTKLIRNIIWQAYTWISDGRMEPIEGNLRSFWYLNVKPVLSRLGLEVSGARYTDKVYDTFVEMVTVHRLFRYVDFGFLDDRLFHRVIGGKNGHLILFIEKDGLFSLVRQIALKHDATAIALNGFPSYLTSEFLIRDMAKAGILREPVHLFGLTDYDPAGYWIEREFAEQLRTFGVEIGSVHSVMDLGLLPSHLLEVYKYRLKASARTRNWLEVTGGIAGEAFGLEADALGGKRVRQAYGDAVASYLASSRGRRPGRKASLSGERERWFEWITAEASY